MFSFMFFFITIFFIPSGQWLCLMLEVYLFVWSSSFQAPISCKSLLLLNYHILLCGLLVLFCYLVGCHGFLILIFWLQTHQMSYKSLHISSFFFHAYLPQFILLDILPSQEMIPSFVSLASYLHKASQLLFKFRDDFWWTCLLFKLVIDT